jgi:hypothetical protein
VIKFKQTGAVIENKRTAGRKKSVRVPENTACEQEIVTCGPNRSVKQLSQQLK